MDWSEIPKSRYLSWLTCLLPGVSALYLIYLHDVPRYSRLWDTSRFGYSTKLTILMTAAYVLGYPLQSIFQQLYSFHTYRLVLAALKPIPADSEKPWESGVWRALLMQIIPSGLPTDASEVSSKMWKSWWMRIDAEVTRWESQKGRGTDMIGVAMLSACSILLVGSLFDKGIFSIWLVFGELFWVRSVHVQIRNLVARVTGWESRASDQQDYLMKLVMTKVAKIEIT